MPTGTDNSVEVECSHFSGTVSKVQTPSGSCQECGYSEGLWKCADCGFLACGRYSNGHALEHYETFYHHVAINVATNDPFCYSCDNFVPVVILPGMSKENHKRPKLVSESLGESSDSQIEDDDEEEESEREIVSESTDNEKDAQSDDSLDSLQARTRSGLRGKLGLRNLGNSCYLNSILQVLSHVPKFRDFFLHHKKISVSDTLLHTLESLPSRSSSRRKDHDLEMIEKISLISEMTLLLRNLWMPKRSKSKYYSPTSIFTSIRYCFPRFGGYQQQDAQECLHLLLERLHYEIVELKAGKHRSTLPQESIITSAFQGQMSSNVACLNCRNVAVKSDPFQDVPLVVPNSYFLRKDSSSGSLSLRYCNLFDCLKRFCTSETLVHSEMYRCSRCGSLSEAIKDMRFAKLPPTLVFQLKRFDFNQQVLKVRTYVEFPLQDLDLSGFCRDSSAGSARNLYNLLGVVCHHGSSPRQGHYTAYIRDVSSDGWCHYDDSKVTPVTPLEVASCEAYILVYTCV